MAFEKGKPRPESAGRKPGTPNKRTLDAMALADELGCDPLKVLLLFAKGDAKGLGYVSYDEDSGKEIVGTIDPEMRLSAAKEAAAYIYPKRKAIEHSIDPEKGATLEEFIHGLSGKEQK